MSYDWCQDTSDPRHFGAADTVNTFKNRLDKFWLNQEVIFNYKADLAGTGNRSIINY